MSNFCERQQKKPKAFNLSAELLQNVVGLRVLFVNDKLSTSTTATTTTTMAAATTAATTMAATTTFKMVENGEMSKSE